MKQSPYRFVVFAIAPMVALCAHRSVQAGTPPPHIPVDLEYRPESPTVILGDTIPVGLYAAAEDEPGQLISNLQVILKWDPGELRLQGPPVNDGDYNWLASFFPVGPGLDPDGLNNTFDDGDAFYLAWAQLPPRPFPFVTTPGLHVTTFLFEALQETPDAQITMMDRVEVSETFVLDGRIPGNQVTGTLNAVSIRIVPEPATAVLVSMLIPWAFLKCRRGNRRH